MLPGTGRIAARISCNRASAVGMLLALATMSGCASSTLGDGFVLEPERVVEATAPPRTRFDKPVIVLDVRPLDQYQTGHLGGARWLDLTTWTRLSRSYNKGFADQAGWQKRIGDLGIAADDRVLVYDGGEMTEASRVWYILQLFGMRSVVVLDGGYPGLSVSAAEKIVPGEPSTPVAREFKPTHPSWPGRRPAVPMAKLADKAAVRGTIASKSAKIVDARTRAEFEGRDRKSNPRAGHLPDAVNIPHGELLDARGRLRTAAELQKLFADAGVKAGDAIVTHCQSGGRAALAALAAKRAGFADVWNYYMSFSEWAQDDMCPLAGEAEATARIGADEHR
jgi:thiosulfate/3-mercaptopyruvate sulfurtransferase